MTGAELMLIVGAVLSVLACCALVVVLLRVLDALRALRGEVEALRAATTPLLAELRATTEEAQRTVDAARDDLERFDRVLGSAEAIGDAVAGSGRVARTALSAPVIKVAGLATGTSRAVRRLRSRDAGAIEIVTHPGRSTVEHGRRRA